MLKTVDHYQSGQYYDLDPITAEDFISKGLAEVAHRPPGPSEFKNA
jgi:hypothetical protein